MELKTKSIHKILRKYRIRPNKKLGQHFVTDWGLLERIAESCELHPNSAVIEIGAGIGSLSECLSQYCGVVFAIERDRAFRRIHEDLFADDRKISFIYDNALSVDFSEIYSQAQRDYGSAELIIAGNIPFSITSPVIRKICDLPNLTRAVLMVQREVANRICASEGSKRFGILSVTTQYYFDVEILFDVLRAMFSPRPNVDSSVVSFTPKPSVRYNDKELEEGFFQFVKAAFSQRRKTLRNSLFSKGYLSDISRTDFFQFLESLDLPEKVRPEQISIDKLHTIFESVGMDRNDGNIGKKARSSVVVSFGSNVGEKAENIAKALELLEADPQIEVGKTSRLFRTSPVGYEDQDWFVNASAIIETDYSPDQLLLLLKEIEQNIGREETFPMGPRVIDIDIIFYDNVSCKTDSLEIPHPRALERLFVLIPLLDIDPDFVHPLTAIPVRKYCDDLKSNETVERLEVGG